jgi:hypothetical protein
VSAVTVVRRMFSGGLIITYQFTVGLLRVSAYPVLDAAAVILLKGLLDAYGKLVMVREMELMHSNLIF